MDHTLAHLQTLAAIIANGLLIVLLTFVGSISAAVLTVWAYAGLRFSLRQAEMVDRDIAAERASDLKQIEHRS